MPTRSSARRRATSRGAGQRRQPRQRHGSWTNNELRSPRTRDPSRLAAQTRDTSDESPTTSDRQHEQPSDGYRRGQRPQTTVCENTRQARRMTAGKQPLEQFLADVDRKQNLLPVPWVDSPAG